MSQFSNYEEDFRIELSGWGLDNDFFAERTDLQWTADGEKQVQLHRTLQEGTIVFVRLLSSEDFRGSVPVAYRVEGVMPMDCNGRCQVKLAQQHPRAKESSGGKVASNGAEGSKRACDVQEFEGKLRREEILQ